MSYDWRKILIRKEKKIKEVLELIDKESLRIALIVDEKFHLLGVVTDGDVRRGLLRNISLDSAVEEIMNSNPITSKLGTSRKELIELMEKEQLLAVPLLQDNIVSGLETLQKIENKSVYQNAIFIMAGGFGTRLHPLTENCPKPLLKIDNRPILEIMLESFIKAGFVNFYISTHYLPEMVMNYFGDGTKWKVNINYVYEKSPLGTGGALGLLPENLPDIPIIVINGDILTTVNFEKLLQFHNKNNAAATMCVRDYEYKVPFGVINGEGNRVIGMVEKPVQRFFINAGVYVINNEIRREVLKNYRIDMPELLEKLIDKKLNVMMFPIHEYWLDIGRMEDYERAQNDIINLEL